MKTVWKAVGLLALLAAAIYGFLQFRKAMDAASAAQLLAAQTERAALVRDSIYQASKDSFVLVSQARKDSIERLKVSGSTISRRLKALSDSIDALVAADSNGTGMLPPDATALDSAKAQAQFWHARYQERTEAQRLAELETANVKAQNLILTSHVVSLETRLAQSDSLARSWKASSDAWKAVGDCRIPLIGLGCPSRTVIGVASAIGGLIVGR